MRAVAADARLARGARSRDDGGPPRDRELRGESTGDAAGAVHEDPLADRGACGLAERLVGGERGHREGGGYLPRNGGRFPGDECGRSNKPLRPRALVSQRQWVSEHLVARCEACHVLANRVDNARRLDAQRQRWSAADVPVAHPDDLVPVADPCRPHREHDLIRGGRRRRGELEHAHLGAECLDAGGLHPLHSHHLRGS
jgi:hypothetical protein